MKTFVLRDYPEIAKELGFLQMFTSNLGIMLVPILTALLQGDAITAQAISVKVDNITSKLDILFTIATDRTASDPLAKAIMDGEPAIRSAISYRNKLAHGLYVADQKTSAFELFENLLTDRRGKPRCTELNPALIKAECDGLENAIVKVLNVGGDRIKNPLDMN